MGRQMIYRDTRMIGASISTRLFNKALEVQARCGIKTFTEVIERALQMYTDQILGPQHVSGVGESQTARPGKVSLAIGDDVPIEDPPSVTALVPEEEAIAAVDQPRPFDPAVDSVLDYIRGKRS